MIPSQRKQANNTSTGPIMIGAVVLVLVTALGIGLRPGAPDEPEPAPARQETATTIVATADGATGQPQLVSQAGLARAGRAGPADRKAARPVPPTVGNGQVKYRFPEGQHELPEEAATALADIVRGVATGQTVVVHSYSTPADTPADRELRLQRVEGVRELLLSLGIAPDKISLHDQQVVPYDEEPDRVEVTLED